MTANTFESTLTNDNAVAWPNLPSVYRAIFETRKGGEIHIVRYQDETGVDFRSRVQGPLRWNEFGATDAQTSPGARNLTPNDNFYDIPIIFGARKGIPNFNEFTANTVVHMSRKLQLQKDP